MVNILNGNKSEVGKLRSRTDDVMSTCEVNGNEPTQPNEKEEESSGQGNFDDNSESRNDEAFEDDGVCREISSSVRGCSDLNYSNDQCEAEALNHSSVSQLGPVEMENISDISDVEMETEVSNMSTKVDAKHPPSIQATLPFHSVQTEAKEKVENNLDLHVIHQKLDILLER